MIEIRCLNVDSRPKVLMQNRPEERLTQSPEKLTRNDQELFHKLTKYLEVTLHRLNEFDCSYDITIVAAPKKHGVDGFIEYVNKRDRVEVETIKQRLEGIAEDMSKKLRGNFGLELKFSKQITARWS